MAYTLLCYGFLWEAAVEEKMYFYWKDTGFSNGLDLFLFSDCFHFFCFISHFRSCILIFSFSLRFVFQTLLFFLFPGFLFSAHTFSFPFHFLSLASRYPGIFSPSFSSSLCPCVSLISICHIIRLWIGQDGGTGVVVVGRSVRWWEKCKHFPKLAFFYPFFFVLSSPFSRDLSESFCFYLFHFIDYSPHNRLAFSSSLCVIFFLLLVRSDIPPICFFFFISFFISLYYIYWHYWLM